VLLVATVRTEEMIDAPAVTRLLRELNSDRHFASLTLAPLSPADTVTLVRLLARAGTDEPAVQRLGTQIWRASEGNPFMVVEAMRSLYGSDTVEVPGELPIPPRVRDIITARLDRLSPHGRDVVALASVIGREFDYALLESAAGAEGPRTATSVEELVAHRVLHVVDERLDFTHDRLVPYERHNVVIAFAEGCEGCEGSMARYLAQLAATLARWDEAIRHFDAALAMNSALGAWPQVAHTQREYAAMLRARGATGDQARAAALHAAARATYERLGMSTFT
jgi:hypothetical protein